MFVEKTKINVFYFDVILGAIKESLKGTTREAFDRVVLVHNVGTMGTSKLANKLSDVNDWKEVYDVNFFVPMILNTVIMNMFDDSTNTKKVIINITSLFGIKATIGYGQYCSVKAAREMYFKVLVILFFNFVYTYLYKFVTYSYY